MKTLITALIFATAIVAPSFADYAEPDRSAERKVEMEEDMYEDATELLDEHEWRKAAQKFREVAELKMAHADGALYWLAYAQNKMGQRPEALATLLDLQKTFPHSRYLKDGKALEVEIRNSSGQRVEPSTVVDDDVKLMAIQGLMNSDPERAVPILEKLIFNPNSSPKIRERAIFVLSQSKHPKAMEIIGRVARDGSRPELQSKALRYLGIAGGETSKKMLAEVYASSNDIKIKKSILKAYMIAGDRGRVLALAKTEQNEELRADAVTQLGLMGARAELADMYAKEPSTDIRKRIIHAMFLGGHVEKLAEIARSERVPELRLAAIKNLGLIGHGRTGPLLLEIYQTDQSLEVKKAVIKALFLQQNARTLVDLARKEKNPELKKEIISKLSLIQSKEAADYLLEYLQE